MTPWYVGNAIQDSADTRGWFVGHFLEAGNLRTSDEVELKWGIHPAGEAREGTVTDEARTTVLILISGRFRVDLSAGSHVLEKQGDYAMWGQGIDHSWEAEE